MTDFPEAYWQAWDADAVFIPKTLPPLLEPRPLYAVLVFLYCGEKVVLADIPERGLCIPSGRIGAGESPDQAAEREVWEETGAKIEGLRPIGHYRLIGRGDQKKEPRWSPVYVATTSRFLPIPSASESRGVFLADPADLPFLYFFWDPLIEAVFAYAHTFHQR